MTTIFGTLAALALGATVGGVTLVGLVHSQTSPKGESPASITAPQDEIIYGSSQ